MKHCHYLCMLMCVHLMNGARILSFLPIPSISHQAIFQPILRELSLRGHQVTVITPNPLNNAALSNLTEIDVGLHAYEIVNSANAVNNLDNSRSPFARMMFYFHMFDSIIRRELEEEEVAELIKSDETFELIILQVPVIQPLVYGFAAKFKSPVIALSSLEVLLQTHDAFGNPTHPLLNPDLLLDFEDKLSFAKRVKSVLFNIWYRMVYYWYALPRADEIARTYFGDEIPYLGDIEKNTSLLLINVNPLIHRIRPNVPNIIEINQVHIRERKPLPKDIQEYLDSSPQGVIYFSLGSNVKSANLTTPTRNVIVEALADLPYNVIWKWENDYFPGQPENVMVRKWLPQQDILAHPYIKVFITQGGLQSIEESIVNGVPMVGLPFYSDQPTNIKRIVKLKMGLGLDHRMLTKKQLKDAIIEVAENTEYKEQVKKSRAILTDQPIKGVEKAVWWIEYVLRHKGAKHLRSAAADMPFYEYFMVDVIFFLVLCIILLIYVNMRGLQLMVWLTKTNHKLKLN